MAREFTVVANLLADPEVRDANGKDVVNLDFCENLGYFNKDSEWVETGKVDYTAAIWDNGFQSTLFANVADSLHKGDKIVAVVRLRGEGIQVFERNNGDLGGKLEVDIIEIAASLKNATVEITRNKKKSNRSDDDDAPRGRSNSRGRSSRSDDGDEDAPKRSTSSRSRARSDEGDSDGDEDAPKRSTSSRGRSSRASTDEDAPRRGSASRGRSRASNDDDAF